MIADQMEEWLFTEASDGFNIMFPYLPGGLNDSLYRVVPELQRRGLFRREYEGAMLRGRISACRAPATASFQERRVSSNTQLTRSDSRWKAIFTL